METARNVPSTPSSLASDFQTPRSQTRRIQQTFSPDTPDTEQGNESFSSGGGNSDMTPQVDSLSSGRGRGRPRKKLDYTINMDDFPTDGTQEEKDKYMKKKSSELWRLKMLTSDNAAEHRAKENARVKKYYEKKKGEKGSSTSKATPRSTPKSTATHTVTRDDDGDDDIVELSASKKREQSRIR